MRNVLNVNNLGSEIKIAISNSNQSKKLFAASIGITRQTLDNYIMKNNMPLKVFNKLVFKYPNVANIFNINVINSYFAKNLDNPLQPKKTNQPTSTLLADNPNQPKAEKHIIVPSTTLPQLKQGDELGIKQINLNNHIIDTSSIYIVVTSTDTYIKHLQLDHKDKNIIWCHTPDYPKFSIPISEIKSIYKAIYKISKL